MASSKSTSTANVARSAADKQQRLVQMREMAVEGYTSRQMAATFGLSEERCRRIIHKEGIDVPADRVTRGSRRHDANRILEHIVMDAENLTADENLIDFDAIDRDKLKQWISSLSQAGQALEAFKARLADHQHGATEISPEEESAGTVRAGDAGMQLVETEQIKDCESRHLLEDPYRLDLTKPVANLSTDLDQTDDVDLVMERFDWLNPERDDSAAYERFLGEGEFIQAPDRDALFAAVDDVYGQIVSDEDGPARLEEVVFRTQKRIYAVRFVDGNWLSSRHRRSGGDELPPRGTLKSAQQKLQTLSKRLIRDLKLNNRRRTWSATDANQWLHQRPDWLGQNLQVINARRAGIFYLTVKGIRLKDLAQQAITWDGLLVGRVKPSELALAVTAALKGGTAQAIRNKISHKPASSSM